jgi:hypothetical protein
MRFSVAVGILTVALAGCNRAAETGRTQQATDTVVTTKQTQDTALVTHDTTVKVDTTVKHGDRTLRTDTVKKTTGARQRGSDTTTAR